MTRWLARLVWLVLLGVLSACTRAPPRPAVIDPQWADCQQLFIANDALLRAAKVHDAQTTRVTGYTFLRVDRLLASLASDVNNGTQRQAWLARATALDAEGRALEIARLSPAPDGTIVDQLRSCRAILGVALRDDDNAWRAMVNVIQIADDYSVIRRVLGVYPISARLVLAGVARLQSRAMPRLLDHRAVEAISSETYGLRSETPDKTHEPAPGPWQRDALGIPQLGEAELTALLRRHAPELSIETRSNDDRPGRISRNSAPFVHSAEPVLYTQLAYTRFGGQVLPQLVYSWWFAARTAQSSIDLVAGPLDGLSWRVTLDHNRQPLAYDLVHNCGCYHMFFPSPRLRVRAPTRALEEPAWIPFTIPSEWHARLRLVLASGSHYLSAITPASATPPDHGYTLRPYDDLRAIPARGQHVSLFDARGLVPNSARGERWFLWPMGIVAPGSMRQSGHQATAFVGRRHFDDARLLERYFEPVESTAADD